MGGASAPPFFRHFPFKIGVLEAHPGKICLPLILICLPQILIRGRQSKIMRRMGKIGRRKVFPKVKNVNVKSLKIGSKLLDFWSAEPTPNPSLKGRTFQKPTPNPSLKGRAFQKPTPSPSLKGRAFLSLPQPLPKGKGFSNFNMRVCATFCEEFNV